MADTQPVWLITGCSTGFGRELAKLIVARGWNGVFTSRNADDVADIVEGHEDRALALALDVTNDDQIANAVAKAMETFGRIDVLVNNAGYGFQSTVEEASEADVRAQFDANVFGLFALTCAVLPHMRKASSGHVINITSVAGLIGFPGSGYYAASKHAVEGWSDALYAEAKPLGIHVTCVEPGPFRTDWAGRSLHQTETKIAEYAETAGKRLEGTRDGSGDQAGDPVRAGKAMIELTEDQDPPRHLVLGKWGYDAVVEKLAERKAEIERYRDRSLSADFPNS